MRRIGYGGMSLVGRGGWGEPGDRGNARELLRRAVALGVQLFDTADSYGPEISEELIADALHPYPAGIVVATKGGSVRDGPWQLRAEGHPTHLRAACEGSLRRLRLDRIDLYQLHAVDPRVPLEESVGALAELRAEGKIRHLGLSNVSVDQIAAARAVAPIVAVQNEYNLATHAVQKHVVAYCEREGLAYVSWRPLGKGSLTRARGALARVARRHGATPAQVALAWQLATSAIVVPIPGTASVSHLEENVGALDLRLTPEDVDELRTYTPPLDARTLARRYLPRRARRVAAALLNVRRRGLRA